MKKFNLGMRILAFVLVFLTVTSLVPVSVFAATKGEIVTNTNKGKTGIDVSTLNQKDAINWPVKVYDYLADGMLFEFAQYQGSTLSSNPHKSYEAGGGQYVLGDPMPYGKHDLYSNPYGTDFTLKETYSTNAYNAQWASGRGARYTRTPVAAKDYENPRYVRYKINTAGNSSSNRNIVVSDFRNDVTFNMYHSTIRYMVIVYRSSGMATTTTNDYHGSSMAPLSILIQPVTTSSATEGSSWSRLNYNKWTNSSEWTYAVIDLNSLGFTANYTTSLAISPNFQSASAYLDVSHVAYFSNSGPATTFGQNCVKFDKRPGEYVDATAWNAANNTAFGMYYASNGAAWEAAADTNGDGNYSNDNYGGNPNTSTLGGTHAAYYTHQIGYRIPTYDSSANYYNQYRKTGRDSATGRYNGTGDLMGENGIYYINGTYYTSSAYQTKYPNATSFDMSELTFDGYNLLTQATSGGWTAGLLEGKLNADGTPEYRQETVEYIADLLSKTLTIPQYGTNGNANYTYVAGGKNPDFGKTNGENNDLAQGLRNALGITFSSGASRGTTPQMGTYAETIAKSDKLKGKFLSVANAGHITTCMDAAYYLLHNLFIDDSYNQTQDDFRYLKLSSATLDNGTEAFVFDGGFTNPTKSDATMENLINKTITQDYYKANTQSAVEYNSKHLGLDGKIQLTTVTAKDLYYYAGAEYARTTRFPFLPVVDAEGAFAGQTNSYYFAEDGKRNFDTDLGTYYGRNYNYTMVSNGEFIFIEDDDLYFEFEGDDDVYLFLNGELVLDIGGGHSISNCSLNVNDYVKWARTVLANPSDYTAREIERAQALNLEDGEICSFDFYYMERHGYGANCRIVTNMHITDPDLKIKKSAYQGGKEIDFGGIIDADYPVEYNFTLTNNGNTKLYNLTFDDNDIGVHLTPENGLYVDGDGDSDATNNINGSIVTDANNSMLEATDLTAIVSGYQKVDEGGDYIKTGREYIKVDPGTGTHIYYDGIVTNFKDNEALKDFLKTLEADGTDNSTIDDEQTQSGAGLWVDATVTFKGIYYTLRKEQKQAGVFNNTVKVKATTKSDTTMPGNETLESETQHRVYLRAIPSYYQWADHELFVTEQMILDDASKESGNTGSLLSEYHQFFVDVDGNTEVIDTQFCDKNGTVINDSQVDFVDMFDAADGEWGFKTYYDTHGIYEFYLLMRKQKDANGDTLTNDISKLTKSDYAIVRVLIIVADVEDSVYVLDYGLRTENLDVHGELFKNDELLGSMSGTDTKLMGITTETPSHLKVSDMTSDYNRIDFSSADLGDDPRIEVNGTDGEKDGYFTANLNIGEDGKLIKYDEYSGMYSLTDSGTVLIHADVPYAWDNLKIYYWYDDGTNNGWPGVPMTKTAAGTYKLAIPGNVPHVILTSEIPVYDDEGVMTGRQFIQTKDIHINPGQESWITVDPNLTEGETKYTASVGYNSTDGIVHVSVPEGWGDVYYHCWDAFDNPLTAWPGTQITEVDAEGYYTIKTPGDISNIIINNNAGKQTADLVIYAGQESWLTVTDKVTGTTEDGSTTYYGATVSRSNATVTMHATVPEDWNCAYLYYWNSNGSATGVTWPGIEMTVDPENPQLYHLENVPADVTNVIIDNGDGGGKQTVDTLITPGLETWLNVNDLDPDTKAKFTVPSDWGDVYVYYFNDNGDVGKGWPGTNITKAGTLSYEVDIPAYATGFIVNNNSNKQTQNLGIEYQGLNQYVINSNGKAYGVDGSPSKLYISVPGGFGNPYIHYWGGAEQTNWPGTELTEKNSDGKYFIELPGDTVDFKIHNNNGWDFGDSKVALPGKVNYITLVSENYNNYLKSYPEKEIPWKNTISVTYGENSLEEGFSFTPTNFMDSVYDLYMALTIHEPLVNSDKDYVGKPTPIGDKAAPTENPDTDYTVDIGKEVQLYKKVSVLPANVVYYEDDFEGVTYTTKAPNILSHYGAGSGSLTQKVDQNSNYGSDIVYKGSENDEMSGASLIDVNMKTPGELATFKFTGTGFEIIGHTHAVEAGTIMVKVTNDSGFEQWIPVITEFDNNDDGGTDTITSVPIVRVSGLEYGEYTVTIEGVPIFDFDSWDGTGEPPVNTSFICLDGIRVYQPLKGGSGTEATNVALNKSYDATIAESSYGNYDANLTDGVAANAIDYTNRSDWFGFNVSLNMENGVGYATVDLGREYDLSKFRAHLSYDQTSDGIAQPQYIEVAVSKDNKTYDYVCNLGVKASSTESYWAEGTTDSVIGRYVRFYVYKSTGNYSWHFINELEVYGKELADAGKHEYYLETENGAGFTEIRELVSNNQAFAVEYTMEDGLVVSGGTTTWVENRNNADPSDGREWTSNKVTSVEDYLLAGPNNEVYLVESTEELSAALALYVTETGSGVHNLQIGIRAMDYGAFIGANTTGHIDTTVQYGAMVDGKFVWKDLASIVSTVEQYHTIPYDECPYDEENDRYQVVLRVKDTAITGMASFTTLKTNGIMLNTLSSSDLPEAIYVDELTNEMIDNYGNTIASSAFVNYIALANQMKSQISMINESVDNGSTVEVIDGVNTSSLSSLYDTYTANSSYDFNLTEKSKFYIVTTSESTAPSDEIIETVKLAQKQFAADGIPTSENLRIVWGLEKYAEPGDILIYVDSGNFAGVENYDEAFKLEVTDRAKIYTRYDTGLLYALNTLQKHFRKAGVNALEGFTVEDAPDTKERTVHLDIARKYLTKEWVCNYIREMSWMGYNALELHLAEDGGFRADIWDDYYYPQASGISDNDFSWAIGSEEQYWCYDCPDPDKGKYLTAAELVQICNVAKEYNIEIIPSFDTPAHVGWMTKRYTTLLQSGNTSIMNFNYNGSAYTLPTRLHYRNNGYSSDYAVLNLGNANVQRFAFAMYTDIAAFFKEYAGSTKFNICGDEVALGSSDTWDFADFVDYVNEINGILNNMGYTTRMYNDFLDRTKYINAADRTVAALDSNIEIVYWDAPNTSGATSDIRKASYWYNSGRVIHSGVQNWTYYVLRLFNTPGYESNAIFGMDARHPNNTWWSFSRNTEDRIYNEWNPTRLSESHDLAGTQSTDEYYSGEYLASGYFMVWCDYAGLNTEQEMWNGINDNTEYASTSGGEYSLRKRMWSGAVKMWNWDINSTVSFASYGAIRDTLGDFPGLVSGTNGCSTAAALGNSSEVYGPFRTEYTVNFVDHDGTVIDTQIVIEGNDAVAPEDPVREADAWFTYEFTGWSDTFENITSNKTIVAQYKETSTVPGLMGNFEVEVVGGSNFNLSINDGTARPMGTSYVNAKMELAAKITVTAETTGGNRFIGWINAATSEIVTTSLSYTFYTSGSDILIALFDTDIANMSTVIFKNDIANQIVDIQYYSADSTIEFPEGPAYLGYEFLGWNLTEAEIIQRIIDGKDVTVLPVWGLNDSYFSISVTGGKVTDNEGMDANDKYVGYKGTTVTADEPASGKKFAYWVDADNKVVSYEAEYKFYPYEDTTLKAVFVDEATAVNYNVVVDVAVDSTTYADKNTVFMSWSVPEETGFTFVNAGILIVDQENYNETMFALGTNDKNIIQFVPGRKYQVATGMHSITQTNVNKGDTKVVRAFVQYRDANNVLQVAYSDIVTNTK